MTLGWRNTVLFALYAVVTAAIVWRAPIPQPTSYHGFADDRTIWGIANFFNVVSNAAFLVPGVAGLSLCLRQPPARARWFEPRTGEWSDAASADGASVTFQTPSDTDYLLVMRAD